MRVMLTILMVGLLLAPATFAQEAINLTVAKSTPNVTTYAPKALTITLAPNPSIHVVITANGTGIDEVFNYPCSAVAGDVNACATDTSAEVTTLITALNTANLTTRSLWRRVFDRLCADFPLRFVGGCTVP